MLYFLMLLSIALGAKVYFKIDSSNVSDIIINVNEISDCTFNDGLLQDEASIQLVDYDTKNYNYEKFTQGSEQNSIETKLYISQPLINQGLILNVSCNNTGILQTFWIGPFYGGPDIPGYQSMNIFIDYQFQGNNFFGIACAVIRYLRPLVNLLAEFFWFPLLAIAIRPQIPHNLFMLVLASTFPMLRQSPRDQAFVQVINYDTTSWSLFGTPPTENYRGVPPILTTLGFFQDFYYNLDLCIGGIIIITIGFCLYEVYVKITTKTQIPSNILNYSLATIQYCSIELQLGFLAQIYGVFMVEDYSPEKIILLLVSLGAYIGLILLNLQQYRIAQDLTNDLTEVYENWDKFVRERLNQASKLTGHELKKIIVAIPKYRYAMNILQLKPNIRACFITQNNTDEKHKKIIYAEIIFSLIDQVLILLLVFVSFPEDSAPQNLYSYNDFWSSFYRRFCLSFMSMSFLAKGVISHKLQPDGSDDQVSKVSQYCRTLNYFCFAAFVACLLILDEVIPSNVNSNNVRDFYIVGVIMSFLFFACITLYLVFMSVKMYQFYYLIPQLQTQNYYIHLTIASLKINIDNITLTEENQVELFNRTMTLEVPEKQSQSQENRLETFVTVDKQQDSRQDNNSKIDDKYDSKNKLASQFDQRSRDQLLIQETQPDEKQLDNSSLFDNPEYQHHFSDVDHLDKPPNPPQYYTIPEELYPQQLGDMIASELILTQLNGHLQRKSEITPTPISRSRQSQETIPYQIEMITNGQTKMFTKLYRNGFTDIEENHVLLSFWFNRVVMIDGKQHFVGKKQNFANFSSNPNKQIQVYGHYKITLHNISDHLDCCIESLRIKNIQGGKTIKQDRIIQRLISPQKKYKFEYSIEIDQTLMQELDELSELYIRISYQMKETGMIRSQVESQSAEQSEQSDTDNKKIQHKEEQDFLDQYMTKIQSKRRSRINVHNLTIKTDLENNKKNISFKFYSGTMKLIQVRNFTQTSYQRLIKNISNLTLLFEKTSHGPPSREQLLELDRQFLPFENFSDEIVQKFMKFDVLGYGAFLTKFYILLEITSNRLTISVFFKTKKYSLSLLTLIKFFSETLFERILERGE